MIDDLLQLTDFLVMLNGAKRSEASGLGRGRPGSQTQYIAFGVPTPCLPEWVRATTGGCPYESHLLRSAQDDKTVHDERAITWEWI